MVVRQQRDMALTTKPERSSNVGMRNFQTRAATAGEIVLSAATNAFQVAAELVVRVDSTALPRGWKAEVLAPASETRLSEATERKARLLGAHGRLLEPGATALVPVRVTPPPEAPPGSAADVRIEAALLPLVAGTRTPIGNGFTYRVVVDSTKRCPCR
ncbi:MAG TPA: hypothetical protein VHR41_02560 [Gemmatimonadales bacterium]|nr:hypothetical protein [Gemmatimonadales bacterium]